VLDARLLLANGSTAAANRDPNKTQRLQNLRRAFNARAVARDRRQAGRQLHVAARDEAVHRQLYSVQIDPNEIPGIEAMGVVNYKSLAEVRGACGLAVSAVPAVGGARILKDCVDNKVSGIGFFTSGFSEDDRGAGYPARRAVAGNGHGG